MKNKIGFDSEEKEAEPDEIYIGTEVCINHNGNVYYGVFEKVNRTEGYAYLNPSLLANPDSTHVFLVTDRPTKVRLPYDGIRPLPEGTLEEFVRRHNEKQRKLEEKALLEHQPSQQQT